MITQSLEQAILVSLNHTISLQLVHEWAMEEDCEEMYDEFLRQQNKGGELYDQKTKVSL